MLRGLHFKHCDAQIPLVTPCISSSDVGFFFWKRHSVQAVRTTANLRPGHLPFAMAHPPSYPSRPRSPPATMGPVGKGFCMWCACLISPRFPRSPSGVFWCSVCLGRASFPTGPSVGLRHFPALENQTPGVAFLLCVLASWPLPGSGFVSAHLSPERCIPRLHDVCG